MAFVPNTTGFLTRYTGRDKFGQALYGAAGVTVRCSVVKLQPTVEKTPIRSTASASRGEADEIVDPAMILFPVNVAITEGDHFAIAGNNLRCTGVQPRIATSGKTDHYECTFEVAEPLTSDAPQSPLAQLLATLTPAAIAALPTTLPSLPGILWLNEGVLMIS